MGFEPNLSFGAYLMQCPKYISQNFQYLLLTTE